MPILLALRHERFVRSPDLAPRGSALARIRGGRPARRRPTDGAAGRDFFTLSFGQQKLVLLCRALVKKPRLFLLDEPSHGLSSVNRQRLLAMLRTLAEDPKIALVLVTHRQDEIDQLGFENVLRLEGGQESE